MGEIAFVSRLPAAHRDELELLMFFHPHQTEMSGPIVEAIEKYGAPWVAEEDGYLRLRVGEGLDVQNLFGLVGDGDKTELAGMAIFSRIDTETVVLLHIAVKPEFSITAKHARELVTLRIIMKLCEIARQIRGVRHLEVLYGNGLVRRIR